MICIGDRKDLQLLEFSGFPHIGQLGLLAEEGSWKQSVAVFQVLNTWLLGTALQDKQFQGTRHIPYLGLLFCRCPCPSTCLAASSGSNWIFVFAHHAGNPLIVLGGHPPTELETCVRNLPKFGLYFLHCTLSVACCVSSARHNSRSSTWLMTIPSTVPSGLFFT